VARILCIETSTKVCSVGLQEDGEITQLQEDLTNRYSHAENVNVFIDSVLADVGFSDLDAVAVSQGPGSYTGLRIGVSTAKGICLGQGIPLIAINPLEAMATRVQSTVEALKIPMIDARRMEVFCAGYDASGKNVFETRAEIIDERSFEDLQDYGEVVYFGDGAAKCRKVLHKPRFRYSEAYASALGMAGLAEVKFQNRNFEDLAYFEPFYLKDFVAGKPKKGLT
jgi:tRNA threonylcarbamoyladenosine biosynthesis protein TsaB